MTNPPSRLETDANRYAKFILEGSLLAIDPASGGSSLPGYALYQNGEFVESGVIRMPMSSEIHTRLQYLAKSLRTEFKVPDVLVIEDIPPFMGGKGGDFRTKSTVHLHYSVGVILSAIECPHIIRVTPRTWHSWIETHWTDWKKTDENDAIAMARCVIYKAKEAISGEHPRLLPRRAKTGPKKSPAGNRKKLG